MRNSLSALAVLCTFLIISIPALANPPNKSANRSASSTNTYNIYIKNECYKPIKVLLHIWNTAGKWETLGWLTIQPGKEFYADDTKSNSVYYYAELDEVKLIPALRVPIIKRSHNEVKYDFDKAGISSGYGKKTIVISCPAAKAAYERTKTDKIISSGTGVGLFEDCSYAGKVSTVGAGKYDVSELGIKDNKKLGSVKVPDGWSITVYQNKNYQGSSETFSENISCLAQNWREKVLSVEIKNNNDVKPKTVMPPEDMSLDLVAEQAFIIPVSKKLSTTEAWDRVVSVLSPNGFLRDDIDHKLQSLQTKWKPFSRNNNTFRIRIVIGRSGTESDLQYDLIFYAEESGQKGTSVYEDVKFRSTRMIPKECDKLLADLMRKLGGG